MINTTQLLEDVVAHPRVSNVDMKFLTHIWDAFCRWVAGQFDQKTAVKVLNFGVFSFRVDKIADLEFTNPLFVMTEEYARANGLNDRRPKSVQAADCPETDLHWGQIAQQATELAGEVITKDVVEHAISDVFERLGERCGQDKNGTISIDFQFGKLMCDNKCVEFHFLSKEERDRRQKPPPTASVSGRSRASGRSRGSRRQGAEQELWLEGGSALSSVNGSTKLPDPPLQRYKKPIYKPHTKVEVDELLRSHHAQVQYKENMKQKELHDSMDHYENNLNQLRNEMLTDIQARRSKRVHQKEVATVQQKQFVEKGHRDKEARQVQGINHWPFRTEEDHVLRTAQHNQQLKDNLDAQVEQIEQRRRQQQQAVEAQRPPRLPLPRQVSSSAPLVEMAVNSAYDRYADYLQKRRSAEEAARSFEEEQRYLSEQAEFLRSEENRRRLKDMQDYLKGQMKQKEAKDGETKQLLKSSSSMISSSALPMHPMRDIGEEKFIKTALRSALDKQVADKTQKKQEQHHVERHEQQQFLGRVAHEMGVERARHMARKQATSMMLNETWAKQQELRSMEKGLEKTH